MPDLLRGDVRGFFDPGVMGALPEMSAVGALMEDWQASETARGAPGSPWWIKVLNAWISSGSTGVKGPNITRPWWWGRIAGSFTGGALERQAEPTPSAVGSAPWATSRGSVVSRGTDPDGIRFLRSSMPGGAARRRVGAGT